jgi:hypothetical protein
MLIKRPFWIAQIESAWKEKSIVWLMGLRRVGKTSLCQSLDDVEYLDCETLSTRKTLDDSERFLAKMRGKRVALDEIHLLERPSEILKIAADHYPEVKIIATGSSTLGASAKFRDTLAGRKKEVRLTPLLLEEMELFGKNDLDHRMLFGGFPAFFAKEQLALDQYREWFDAYWAKDIQDMFRVGKRASFLKFAELLFAQSSGQFEASRFAAPCEVTRQTITNYLAVLEETFLAKVLRPYSTHKATEIVSSPKVYGFDTGFMCYEKGWQTLRHEDMGLLWEHIVLNEIDAKLDRARCTLHYWRDKQEHEIDFVISDRFAKTLTAVECKFSSTNPDLALLSRNFSALRKYYPDGENLVVASDIGKFSFVKKYDGLEIEFVSPAMLVQKLAKPRV